MVMAHCLFSKSHTDTHTDTHKHTIKRTILPGTLNLRQFAPFVTFTLFITNPQALYLSLYY